MSCAYKKSGPHRGPLDNSWWRRRESNPRPLPCDGSALPAELRPQARLRVGYCTVLAPSVKRESRKNERLCYEDRVEPRHATWILSIGVRIIRGIGAARDATLAARDTTIDKRRVKTTSLPAGAIMNPPLKRWVPSSAVPPSSTTEDARTEPGIWAPRKRLSVHPVCPAGS